MFVITPLKTKETYHMIDRCDPTIATWSAVGDNFVVKNVEKFATVSILTFQQDLLDFSKSFSHSALIHAGRLASILQTFKLFQFCETTQLLW